MRNEFEVLRKSEFKLDKWKTKKLFYGDILKIPACETF